MNKKRVVVFIGIAIAVFVGVGVSIGILLMPIESSDVLISTQKGEGLDIVEKIAVELNAKVNIGGQSDNVDIYALRVDTNLITVLNVKQYLKNESIVKISYPWELKTQSMYDSDNMEERIRKGK